MAFCALFLCSYACIPDASLQPLNRFTALLLASCLKGLGVAAQLNGEKVLSSSFSVLIIPDCTPALALIIFSSFVLAQEESLIRKSAAILSGVPLLFAVNTLRLVLIFLVSSRHPAYFQVVHVFAGQALMLGSVVTISLGWSRFQAPAAQGSAPLPFLLRVAVNLGWLFLPWVYLQERYMEMLGRLATACWGLLGYSVRTTFPSELFYSTFGIIFFSALILATRELNGVTRTRSLLLGLTTITLTQLVMIMLCNTSFLLQETPGWLYVAFKALCYLHLALPIVLWLAAVHLERGVPVAEEAG